MSEEVAVVVVVVVEPADLRPGMEHLGSSESRVMSHVPRVILVIICVALQSSP